MIRSNMLKCCVIAVCLFCNACSAEDSAIQQGVREFDRGNYTSAIKYFNEALKKNPLNEKTYFNRALSWSEMGKLDSAINDYSKALEINKVFIEAYYNRGITWAKKGNNDVAISDYTKALELNPRNSLKAGIYFNRAYAKLKRGEYEQAIEDYTKSIEIDPQKAELYYLRANVWYEKGNLDSAISDYTKAININPKYVQAIFDRANTWHEKKDYALAIIDYEKATELDSQNGLIYSNYSWLLSTCPDSKFRDGAKALKLALKAVEIRPDESLFLDSLAAAFAELGNFKEAVQIEENAIVLLKEDHKHLKDSFEAQLKSYKSNKPWREGVKRENWMRNYNLQ
jgi:tetratricopeptide (TPR) repeat protein